LTLEARGTSALNRGGTIHQHRGADAVLVARVSLTELGVDVAAFACLAPGAVAKEVSDQIRASAEAGAGIWVAVIDICLAGCAAKARITVTLNGLVEIDALPKHACVQGWVQAVVNLEAL
jgi:hypothetical protein